MDKILEMLISNDWQSKYLGLSIIHTNFLVGDFLNHVNKFWINDSRINIISISYSFYEYEIVYAINGDQYNKHIICKSESGLSYKEEYEL